MKEDNCHSKTGMTNSVNFSGTWLDLLVVLQQSWGQERVSMDWSYPKVPYDQAPEAWNSEIPSQYPKWATGLTSIFPWWVPLSCVGSRLIPWVGTSEPCVGTDHHEFLCFCSLSQGPTNVRSIPTESITHVMEIGVKMGKCPAILFLSHELTYIWNYMYLHARCGLVCHF